MAPNQKEGQFRILTDCLTWHVAFSFQDQPDENGKKQEGLVALVVAAAVNRLRHFECSLVAAITLNSTEDH